LLAIVGIPFLIFVFVVGMELDRMAIEKKNLLFKQIFETTWSNMIFWSLVVIINLVAFVMDSWK
jgi:hypothetical protein